MNNLDLVNDGDETGGNIQNAAHNRDADQDYRYGALTIFVETSTPSTSYHLRFHKVADAGLIVQPNVYGFHSSKFFPFVNALFSKNEKNINILLPEI